MPGTQSPRCVLHIFFCFFLQRGENQAACQPNARLGQAPGGVISGLGDRQWGAVGKNQGIWNLSSQVHFLSACFLPSPVKWRTRLCPRGAESLDEGL